MPVPFIHFVDICIIVFWCSGESGHVCVWLPPFMCVN